MIVFVVLWVLKTTVILEMALLPNTSKPALVLQRKGISIFSDEAGPLRLFCSSFESVPTCMIPGLVSGGKSKQHQVLSKVAFAFGVVEVPPQWYQSLAERVFRYGIVNDLRVLE